MPKSKQAKPKKSPVPVEHQEDALAQRLATLAIDLAAREDRVSKEDDMKAEEAEFHRIIRKCIQYRNDDVLHEALDIAEEGDRDAYLLLKEHIDETSEVVVFRREDGRELEVNAFVIPLFARTIGGLREEECFQDGEAFDLLRKSILDAGLESPDASVVLVSHAYHPDEIRKISHSQIHAMVREAYDAMTHKKARPAPAIEQSMSGWPQSGFAAEDRAVELRFLLGFTLKRMDDRFYHVPKNEAAADAYFDARAERFQQWAQRFAPLVKRCLVAQDRDIEIDFLYQDLFHGGKERGRAEYDMLQMLARLHHELDEHDARPEDARVVVGPVEIDGEMVLRVNLHARADDTLIATFDKPLGAGHDLQSDIDEVHDALTTIGIKSVDVAAQFDPDGRPVKPRPYPR